MQIDQIFEDIVETIREPLLVMDSDLKVILANRSFYGSFKVKPEETVGQLVYDLGNKQWDIPKLRELLETILTEKTFFDNYEVEQDFATIGKRTMLLNARQIERATGEERFILLAIEDITERKRAEVELIKERHFIEVVLDNVKAGIVACDSKGVLTLFNRATQEIHGLPQQPIPAEQWSEYYNLYLADGKTPMEKKDVPLFRALNGEQVSNVEMVIAPKRGKTRTLLASGQTLIDAQGNKLGAVVSMNDITEQKKAIEERDLIFEGSQDLICIAGLDGYFKYVNPAWENLLGYSTHEFLARPFRDFIHPNDHGRNDDEVAGLSKGVKTFGFENRYVCKDGSIRHIQWTATPLPDEEVMSCIGRDITERKEAQEQLLRSEEKYRTLIGNILGMAYRAKSDWSAEIISNSERICGYTPDEFNSGKVNWVELIHPDDKSRVIDDGLKLAEAPSELIQEYRIIAKDGNVHWMRDHKKSYFKDDVFQGIDGVAMDISQQKQENDDRKKIEARLKQAQKMEAIGTLAGGIAHDFNNILSSVIGFTELSLDYAEKGSTIEDSLHEVYTAGLRAKDLVKQILAFARQSEEEIKPIQVGKVVKEVLKFIRSSIPTSIEIKQNIQSDSLIMGNQTQVHQILMNLCTNAAHSMENDGGILDVSLTNIIVDGTTNREKLGLKLGDYIELKVSDTGAGIAPDILDSIFEPYFTTKGPGEGTGMGLAMVHGIVTTYGGKISVDSTSGKGTTFTAYLPITGNRKSDQPYKSEALPTGVERILFVDDELPIAKMGSQILERLNYQVTIRASSVGALELFRSKPNDFDLVITDMTMPNMTGDKLAIELMKIRPDIPVILCTGYSKNISDETASEIGIKGFAFKPVVKSDLARIVRKVLNEAKSRAKQ